MAKVSVVIPSRNEIFLARTIQDIIEKATGNIEVIAVLDGYWPNPPLPDYNNLVVLHRGKAMGMRASINAGAQVATGDYLLKTDAHCMFAPGFDEALAAECDGDWIVIPSRYSLDAENWCIKETGKARVDYHFLGYPFDAAGNDTGLHGQVWTQRARERLDIPVDDEMSFQGSCWFMAKRHFTDFLGGMSEEGYGTFIQEPQEIGLKTWLGGGRVVVNKRTWYAHLHKGKTYGRGYFMDKGEMIRGTNYSTDYWLNDRWRGRKYNLAWLIEKFWPVPTWPKRWLDEHA